MFIAALFTIARTWKQPRCPSADEWIRKLWYIHTMEYYSAIKKNAFESVLMRWMKLEPIIQSEVSQKEKHQYSILTHIYGIWTVNFQMFKLVLEKAEEPEIKLPTSTASSKKQESSRKKAISALLTMPKPLTVCITINCGKFWKRWKYQSTWPASWETYMQVRKQQLELDMEKQIGSK